MYSDVSIRRSNINEIKLSYTYIGETGFIHLVGKMFKKDLRRLMLVLGACRDEFRTAGKMVQTDIFGA